MQGFSNLLIRTREGGQTKEEDISRPDFSSRRAEIMHGPPVSLSLKNFFQTPPLGQRRECAIVQPPRHTCRFFEPTLEGETDHLLSHTLPPLP